MDNYCSLTTSHSIPEFKFSEMLFCPEVFFIQVIVLQNWKVLHTYKLQETVVITIFIKGSLQGKEARAIVKAFSVTVTVM